MQPIFGIVTSFHWRFLDTELELWQVDVLGNSLNERIICEC